MKKRGVSRRVDVFRASALTAIALTAISALLISCGRGDPPARKPSAASGSPAPRIVEGNEDTVEVSVLTRNLQAPWGLAFLPSHDALVTERDTGRLLRVEPSGEVRGVRTLPADGIGEGGLLGVAVHPDFEENRLVYAYYSTLEDNRVVRFRLGVDGPPEPVLRGIPVNSYHNGGRIAFGPDGMLYVGTGDAGDTSNAQDRGSLSGKILRLEPDGGVPPDNPFGNRVYSYGHRNVQGLAWDEEGQLYATEFGQNLYDEVNRIEPGENYGWPEVEGVGGEPEFVDPVATFTTAEASPSGAEILKNGAIPRWEGDFFMAALGGERIWRLELDNDGTVSEKAQLFAGRYGRLRHVAQAPDGSLWVLTSSRDGRGDPAPSDDRILRLAASG